MLPPVISEMGISTSVANRSPHVEAHDKTGIDQGGDEWRLIGAYWQL